MRFDLAHAHVHAMSRRDALKFGAGAAAAATAASAAVDMISAEPALGATTSDYSDEMFDYEYILENGWGISDYGPDDQRGTLNEVTPNRTAATMARMKRGDVKAYQLGEEMFNGFPAFPSEPPRTHDMFLYVFGYEAPQEFVDGGGIQSGTIPFGANEVTGHEERFKENFTFQIATQIDGLNHVGTGQWYYNNNKALDFITPTGTTVLGNETMGPIATRGVILDVVGLKVATGKTEDYFFAPNGEPVLSDGYRVTIDDIENCLHRQRINLPIRAGDVPIIHTGWTHLVRDDPNRYIVTEPGPYLAETRYFADRKVAIVASDTWGWECTNPDVTQGFAFPCHQELLNKNGIRIGESFVTDEAIADNVYEGLLVCTPENVPGATCGSAPPTLLGVKGRKPRN